MTIEDRLRRELHDTAEQIVVGADDYERVLSIGRRRQRLMAVSASMASVAAVAGAIALTSLTSSPTPPIGSATSPPRPATSTTISTSLTEVPMTTGPVTTGPMTTALTAAGLTGISWFDLESGQVTTLASDPGYEAIAWAVNDGAGGVVYVHEVTPLPWQQGSILWLPAAAENPIPLIAPGIGESMSPIDVIDDTFTLIFRYDHQGGTEIRTLDLEDPSTEPLITDAGPIHSVAVDGELVAVVTGTDCLQVDFYNAYGGGSVDVGFRAAGCLAPTSGIGMAGGFIYSLENDGPAARLVMRELATRVTVDSLDAGDAWQLSVGSDGVVAFGGETVTIGQFLAGGFQEWRQLPGHGTIALSGSLAVAAGATLGSGDASLPCTPMPDLPPLAPQNLPPEVEATRQQLYRLAATCDLRGLAEAATITGAVLGFGGTDDPLAYLMENARRGYDIANWITRILNSDPAQLPDGSYAWPAVFVTNAEEDWEAITGTLTAAEYEQLRQSSEYLGFRVGIDRDGRWSYAVAGD